MRFRRRLFAAEEGGERRPPPTYETAVRQSMMRESWNGGMMLCLLIACWTLANGSFVWGAVFLATALLMFFATLTYE